MSGALVKSCEKCGAHFSKPRRYSAAQWSGKRFCSRRCAAMKRRVGDQDIVSQYLNGHSSTQIAETVGLSGANVLRILKKNDVGIRDASTRQLMSQARPEVKKRMSESRKGRRLSEAAKDALRQQVGPQNANWRSGLTVQPNGYLYFTTSKCNGVHAGKAVHRVVAEWKIERALQDGEHVHHVDGNKLNNDPNNLQVMAASDHARLHAVQRGLGKHKRAAR